MKNPNSSKGDPFVDKVQVNFNMLGALVLNGIAGEVYYTHIATIDKASGLKRMVELLKKLAEPGNFSNTIDNGTVFSFSTGAGHGGLALGGPRCKTVSKEHSRRWSDGCRGSQPNQHPCKL
jgi:hypothetical protein